MNKKEFDQIIKENLSAKISKDDFGYSILGNSRVYDTYYENKVFDRFLEEMQSLYSSAYETYSRGKGSELTEHTGRYGKVPPKMASVASSSRFCYLALRNGTEALGGTDQADFEQECIIDGIPGIAPQLDAYVKKENIYVEAKCHEIFDFHRITMKIKYWKLLYGDKTAPAEDTFDIPLSAFGFSPDKKTSMFDIKQFLCHLLGIASQPGESKKLVYLFFRPESDDKAIQKELDEVFLKLDEEINTIFNSDPIRKFCDLNHIKLQAVYECSKTMEALTKDNMKVIY